MWRDAVEAVRQSGRECHTTFLVGDARTCFESVCWKALLLAGLSEGCPLSVLRLSATSYNNPRTVMLGRVVAQPLHPGRGIAAGSAPRQGEYRA